MERVGKMSYEDEQSDEIMAIQSIYGESSLICKSEKPYSGTISAEVDAGLEKYDFICNGAEIPLKHLSHVILDFSFPPNYPYESSPDITLSCLWLSSHQLDNLSNILKDKWKENCGAILYTWMDLLKTEIFNLLDIKFPLEISQSNMLKLTEINLIREEEIFRNSFHFCPICFLEVYGTKCTKLSNCGHIFCNDCLSQFLRVCISDGNVINIICPAEKCDEEVYPHVMKSLLPKVVFDRYDNLMLQRTLSIMADIQYCPRQNCGKPVIVENEEEDLGYCHNCKFAFCIRCNNTYHGVELCKGLNVDKKYLNDVQTYMKMKEMMALQKRARELLPEIGEDGVGMLVDSLVSGNSKDMMNSARVYGQGKVATLASEFWVLTNSKQCPKCRSKIEKTMGCNMMTCGLCHTKFCWVCMSAMKSVNPYEHFSNKSSSCYNLLV